MKRFLKKRWHGIPIGIIASVLIGTAVLAAVVITATQIFHQEIISPEPPPDYGSITSGEFNLDDVVAGTAFTDTPGGVWVDLGSDGVGKNLHLILDDTTTGLYEAYTVEMVSPAAANPTGKVITLTVSKGGTLDASVALPTAGTYIFDFNISGTAGAVIGSPDVTVNVTLDDA